MSFRVKRVGSLKQEKEREKWQDRETERNRDISNEKRKKKGERKGCTLPVDVSRNRNEEPRKSSISKFFDKREPVH